MKNIQEIIKKAAERNGLTYNEDGTAPSVRNSDGSLRVLSPDSIAELFQINSIDKEFGWIKVPNETCKSIQQKHKTIYDNHKEYSSVELWAI